MRATRSWYGSELTLERRVGGWNVEIPVRIGANGGSMIGVARDQIVIQCLVRPNMQGYEVLGVRDDGRLLVSDGSLRGWAGPYTEGEAS